jgi:hypothetical protein
MNRCRALATKLGFSVWHGEVLASLASFLSPQVTIWRLSDCAPDDNLFSSGCLSANMSLASGDGLYLRLYGLYTFDCSVHFHLPKIAHGEALPVEGLSLKL